MNKKLLHTIINKMTAGEKKHFKHFVSRYSSHKYSKYILLYTLIEKQTQYDEQKIETKLRAHGVKGKIYDHKRYLYKLLTRALCDYHFSDSAKRNVNNKLRLIEIFHSKGLIDECEQLIEKAFELSQKHELMYETLECIWWKKKIIVRKYYLDENKVKQVLELDQIWLDKVLNWKGYVDCYLKKNKTHVKGEANQKESILQFYESLMESDIFQNDYKTLTTRAEIMRENLYTYYYLYIKNDVKNFAQHAKKSFHLCQSVDFFGDKYFASRSYQNYIGVCITEKNYKRANEILDEFKRLDMKDVEDTHFFCTTYLKLLLILRQELFSEAEKLQNNIEKGIKKFNRQLGCEYKGMLRVLMIHLFLYGYQYKNASKWVNQLLNDKGMDNYQWLNRARLLNMLVHFELGNYDLLESIVNSNRRFYNKQQVHNQDVDFELMITDFFEDVIYRIDHIKPLDHSWKKLLEDLVEYPEKKLNKNQTHVQIRSFNWKQWVEQKING